MSETSDPKEAEGAAEHHHKTWRERHAATIIAVVSGTILVALIAFQMNC